MSAPLVDPALAQSSLAEQQMQAMQRQAEASRRDLNGGSASDAAKEKKLRQACEGFEAVFIQKMWEGMRASLPKEGLLHSREEQFWQGMYDQELGKSLASAGGIGLADMMVSQLSRKLHSASEVAARRASRVPFEIAPAPRLPSTARPAPKPVAAAANVYDGEAAQPEAALAPVAENAAAEATPAPAAAQATPVAGALQEFASGMGEAAPTSVSTVHVYKAGQRPAQSLDELAASLAAQAAGEGTVRVITTRQVNGANRSRSGRAHPTVRRAAAGRNQGQASAHAVDQAPAQPMEQATRQPAGQPAPLANQPAGSRPGQLSAAAHTPRAGSRPNPAGQPLANQTPGPAAMNVSVEGIGTGSELASNTASGRGIPATEAGETALN